ncbi:Uncharacterised protein [Chlamydia trachomatis]|nr:Uncharacterised protein [Chlamydia trachomatis]
MDKVPSSSFVVTVIYLSVPVFVLVLDEAFLVLFTIEIFASVSLIDDPNSKKLSKISLAVILEGYLLFCNSNIFLYLFGFISLLFTILKFDVEFVASPLISIDIGIV